MDFGTGANKGELLSRTRFHELITKKTPELAQMITVQPILASLRANGVVVLAEVESLQGHSTNSQKVSALMDILQRGDIGRFDGFLNALWDNNQRPVVTGIFGLKEVVHTTAGPTMNPSAPGDCGEAGFRFSQFEDKWALIIPKAKKVNDVLREHKDTLIAMVEYHAGLWAKLEAQLVVDPAQKRVLQALPSSQEITGKLLDGIKTVGQFRKFLVCLHMDGKDFILDNIDLDEDNVYRR